MNSPFETQHIPIIKPPVLFLCLADGDINVSVYQRAGYEIWTLNDYYRVFPNLKPDRIFEIHKPLDMEQLRANGRFPGDYVKVYNDSEAQIVTSYFHGFQKEKLFPGKALEEFGPIFFAATTSYMFALAIMEGYGEITIEGIYLSRSDQHKHLIPGMLRNIDAARGRDIVVRIPGDHESRWRDEVKTFKEDWKEIYG